MIFNGYDDDGVGDWHCDVDDDECLCICLFLSMDGSVISYL